MTQTKKKLWLKLYRDKQLWRWLQCRHNSDKLAKITKHTVDSRCPLQNQTVRYRCSSSEIFSFNSDTWFFIVSMEWIIPFESYELVIKTVHSHSSDIQEATKNWDSRYYENQTQWKIMHLKYLKLCYFAFYFFSSELKWTLSQGPCVLIAKTIIKNPRLVSKMNFK